MNQKNGLQKKRIGKRTSGRIDKEDGKEKVDIKEMRMKAYVLMRHLFKQEVEMIE